MGDLPMDRIRVIASSLAAAIDSMAQSGDGGTAAVAERLDRFARAILDERHEATAGLPQAADEAADWYHPKPQAPADGGEGMPIAGTKHTCPRGLLAIHPDCDACQAGARGRYLPPGEVTLQVAALTAERDGLGRQLMAEIEAKLFNIKEVVKWTELATEHRKELHATRAELHKRDAVVEAAKALRLAQNNWALEEALYTALDALEALTQPAASDVLLVPAKDPARNPALIDSFWRDPGGTED